MGAHRGCCVSTEGLWGIWRALRPRAAHRQARLRRAAFTHTALIAFASFITFIASSLHCLLPGLVERSLWRRRRRRRAHTIGLSVEQEMAAGAFGKSADRNEFDSLFLEGLLFLNKSAAGCLSD